MAEVTLEFGHWNHNYTIKLWHLQDSGMGERGGGGVILERFQLGESLLVSGRIQSGSDSMPGLRADHFCAVEEGKGNKVFLDSCSDFSPWVLTKIKIIIIIIKENKGERQAKFISELCTDIVCCFEDTHLLPISKMSHLFLLNKHFYIPEEWATFALQQSNRHSSSWASFPFGRPLLPHPCAPPSHPISSLFPIIMN